MNNLSIELLGEKNVILLTRKSIKLLLQNTFYSIFEFMEL